MSKLALRPVALAVGLLGLSLTGCHHAASAGAGDGGDTPDLALAGGPYPAVMPDVPQVTSQGGPVLANPLVVPIMFPGEGLTAEIEEFLSTVGATAYWHEATAEYGVGPVTSAPTIHVTDAPPATTTDADIQAWLADRLDGTHPEWPAPTPNTIYAIYYPSSTVITEGNQQSCQAFGGYHNDAGFAGSEQRIVYAVLPRCSQPKFTVLDYLTAVTSHELMEASEDPQPMTNPAYSSVDPNHLPWNRVLGGSETADMCAQNEDANFKPDGFKFEVQRNWSNLAAAAGHDPCVPAAAGASYFNTTPDTPLDDVTLSYMGFSTDTVGWVIPVGQSKTLEFELYSDAPTSGLWNIQALDTSVGMGSTKASTLQLTLDKTTGKNGDKVNLTIKALAASTSKTGTTTVMLRSTLGTIDHFWLGYVQNQ